MDWKRASEEERAALDRIVALLCALAALAERAAGRSAIVRCLVLWFLRHAEAVALDFVDGGPYAPWTSMSPTGSKPADARRLAVSLRAFARQLERQSRRIAAIARQAGGEPAASLPGRILAPRDALASLSWLAAQASGAQHRAFDTS